MCVVLSWLKNGKAIFAFLLDALGQLFARFHARTREQVLTGDEEVMEFTFFQVVLKVLQEQLEAAAQI